LTLICCRHSLQSTAVEVLQHDHSQVDLRSFSHVCSQTERVARWLANTFLPCLLNEGPVCAALLLRVYLEDICAGGTLSQLGSLDASEEYYATVQKGSRKSHRVSAGKASHADQELQEVMQLRDLTIRKMHVNGMDPNASLKQAVAHGISASIALLVRMLVIDEVCCSAACCDCLMQCSSVPSTHAAAVMLLAETCSVGTGHLQLHRRLLH
jgi:hypothetical protein